MSKVDPQKLIDIINEKGRLALSPLIETSTDQEAIMEVLRNLQIYGESSAKVEVESVEPTPEDIENNRLTVKVNITPVQPLHVINLTLTEDPWPGIKRELIERLSDPECDPDLWTGEDRDNFRRVLREELQAKDNVEPGSEAGPYIGS